VCLFANAGLEPGCGTGSKLPKALPFTDDTDSLSKDVLPSDFYF